MGDLHVELSTQLGDLRFGDVNADRLTYRSIDVSVGGTAAHLGFAAVSHFARVNVLARVGQDVFGQFIHERLVAAGVNPLLKPLTGISTGLAVHVRDSSESIQHGVRLLIINHGANPYIERSDVDEHADMIRQSDMFCIDGYCFLSEPRRSAGEHAMRLAKDNAVPVAFDLVPHDAYRYFDLNDVKKWCVSSDIVTVEVRTIRQILGLPSSDEVRDVGEAYATWEVLKDVFPGRSFYLRFGVGNADQSLHCHPNRTPELRDTGYASSSEPRGFGDRLSAADLAEYLAQPPTGT